MNVAVHHRHDQLKMLWKAIDRKGDSIPPHIETSLQMQSSDTLIEKLLNLATGQDSKNRQYMQDHMVTVPLIDQSISEKEIIKHVIKKQGEPKRCSLMKRKCYTFICSRAYLLDPLFQPRIFGSLSTVLRSFLPHCAVQEGLLNGHKQLNRD